MDGQIPYQDGSSPVTVWLWAVPGAGKDARGVSGSFGRAQFQAQQYLAAGLVAVVEPARVVYDLRKRQDTYAPTGRRSTGHLSGDRPVWTRLARTS